MRANVERENVCTLLRQPDRDCAIATSRGTGDEGELSVKFSRQSLLVLLRSDLRHDVELFDQHRRMRKEAAVDADSLTGDIPRLVGGEESDDRWQRRQGPRHSGPAPIR